MKNPLDRVQQPYKEGSETMVPIPSPSREFRCKPLLKGLETMEFLQCKINGLYTNSGNLFVIVFYRCCRRGPLTQNYA